MSDETSGSSEYSRTPASGPGPHRRRAQSAPDCIDALIAWRDLGLMLDRDPVVLRNSRVMSRPVPAHLLPTAADGPSPLLDAFMDPNVPPGPGGSEPGDRIHTPLHPLRVPHRARRGPMRSIPRRTVLAVTAGVVAAPTVSTATAAAADTATTATSEGLRASSGRNPVLRTDLLTRVTPRNNWLVTAVAIQYAHRIDLRGGTVPPTAFQVQATVDGRTAARTVTRVCSNASAEVDNRSHPGTTGGPSDCRTRSERLQRTGGRYRSPSARRCLLRQTGCGRAHPGR
ncbi:hypothetical protein [Streptomyces coeruleorubidus]|uniref:hypothetical protein n=1 Tax=Streptomyces coeruleorubidus TaxID=116188 RepID=UPI0033D3C876